MIMLISLVVSACFNVCSIAMQFCFTQYKLLKKQLKRQKVFTLVLRLNSEDQSSDSCGDISYYLLDTFL